MNMKLTETDVMIVGTGPVGASFARMIHDALPEIRILMIDAGPSISSRIGMHILNIEDEDLRARAQIDSQGPNKRPYPLVSVAERANAANKGQLSLDLLARPGTHLVSSTIEDLLKNEMPAAAHSTNIGGMGAHWTCACPRPGNDEKISFIPPDEYESAYSKAEELLSVTQNAFSPNAESMAIQHLLGETLNYLLSESRKVQPMPLACKINEKGARYWVGPDVILGSLGGCADNENFILRDQTICRELRHADGHIQAAIVEYLPSHAIEEIRAKIFIICCDALRTPQLLWASGIRLNALGHYMNEHPFIFCIVELKEELMDLSLGEKYDPSTRKEPTIGVYWVPFDGPGHPFHGQIMHMDISPLKIATHDNPKQIIGLGWGCRKEIRYDDRIEFSEIDKDFAGMPKMNLKFSLSPADRMEIERAKEIQAKAAAAFGKIIKQGEQTLMPPGTSLHVSGTVRMGERNDGHSVCDSFSRVWDFDNLFVGGNGVIPTAMTSNPTLTSVAMAVRSSREIIRSLI